MSETHQLGLGRQSGSLRAATSRCDPHAAPAILRFWPHQTTRPIRLKYTHFTCLLPLIIVKTGKNIKKFYVKCGSLRKLGHMWIVAASCKFG